MALSKNDLIALVANTIDTNGNEEITAADFRSVMGQMIDSALNTVNGDSRIEVFSMTNNSGVISVTLNAGGTLNLMTTITEAGEAAIGYPPVYKNVAGDTQLTFLDEINDKLLFPSNLQTYATTYTQYIIRLGLNVSHAAVSTNETIELFITLRREVDNSIVSKKTYSIHNHALETDKPITVEFVTFVSSETDPYVVDGMYIEVENNPDSSLSADITGVDLRVFKL